MKLLCLLLVRCLYYFTMTSPKQHSKSFHFLSSILHCHPVRKRTNREEEEVDVSRNIIRCRERSWFMNRESDILCVLQSNIGGGRDSREGGREGSLKLDFSQHREHRRSITQENAAGKREKDKRSRDGKDGRGRLRTREEGNWHNFCRTKCNAYARYLAYSFITMNRCANLAFDLQKLLMY